MIFLFTIEDHVDVQSDIWKNFSHGENCLRSNMKIKIILNWFLDFFVWNLSSVKSFGYLDMISYLGITNQQLASQYQLALPSSKVKVWIQPKDNSMRNEKHCTLEGTPSDVILDVFWRPQLHRDWELWWFIFSFIPNSNTLVSNMTQAKIS